MRSHDVTIPLALWIGAAVCAHFLFGTGGLVVAQMHEDRSHLWSLAREASLLTQQEAQTTEISLGTTSEEAKDEVTPPPPPPPPPPTPKPEDKKTAPEPPKPVDAKKPAPKPEDQQKVVIVKKDEEKKPPTPPTELLKDRRIAVRQQVKPDQQDNKDAHFVADQANHVEKETVATLTSHDRDDANPTPGGNHPGSEPQPGDSEKQRIADSEEHPGEKNRAPGEKGTDFDVLHEPKLPKPEPQPAAATAHPAPTPQGNDRPAQTPGAPPEPVATPGGAAPSSPDIESAPGGSWTFNPSRPGTAPGAAAEPNPGAANPTLPGGKLWSLPGFGAKGPAGAMNTNIAPTQLASIVGSDNLRKLREADGERRKSEHRGAWAASNFDRWRSAIENYVSSVKPGNQTALNTAQVPFASYLNGMHNRIHPIFADAFLDSLDGLPSNHPMNDQHLMTRLEIVLTKDGHLKRMGIVRTSGITAFDIAALDAVDRAQPFGPAPGAIISPDGNVYLHWEFHRDEVYACSTMGATPYLLNTPPKPADPATPPALPNGPPTTPQERGAPTSPNDTREGRLDPARPQPVARGGA